MSKFEKWEDGNGGEGYYFWCPGCDEVHGVKTALNAEERAMAESGKGPWKFNGDVDSPTVSPSVLVSWGKDDPRVCHSFIDGGKIRFLGDCSHGLKGKTVELPEFKI